MPQIPSSLPIMPVNPPAPGNVPWNPKFPQIAVSPQQGTSPGTSTGGLPYEPAPASSHVFGFKVLSGGFVSKFLAPARGASPMTASAFPGNDPTTRAILMVAFKPNAPAGQQHQNVADKEYEYYFPTAADAEGWLNRMRTHAHPGEVVQDLIKAGIPYKRVH